ncbi:MAG: translocation/assembly module TamB domain-containing protein [Bacteroidia bacterium]
MKKVGRIFGSILRFQFRLLSGLILLVFTCFLLLLNATFQDFLGDQVANYFSISWRTKVEIDGFRYQPMRAFSVQRLYIEDHYGDTLLSTGELQLRVRSINLLRQRINLSSLQLNEVDARLHRRAYEQDFNFQFIVDFFKYSQIDTQEVAASPIQFGLDRLLLLNSRITLIDDTKAELHDRLDLRHLNIYDLQLDMEGLYASTDSSAIRLSTLTFKEKGGIAVERSSFLLSLLPDQLLLESLAVQTAESELSGLISMQFGTYADFNDFNNRVRLQLDFDQIFLSPKDMRRIAGPKAPRLPISASGKFSGRLSNLRARELQLNLGYYSYLQGQFNISGLPDIVGALYDIRLTGSQLHRRDLEAAFPQINLPAQIKGLDFLQIDGSGFGYPEDFVATGYFSTNLGKANTDINIKLKGPESTYSGMLAVDRLNLAQLTGDSSLGQLNMHAQIKGKGDSWENFESQLQGEIHAIEYRNYRYRNLSIDGYLERQMFTGKLTAADSNARLSFFGLADFATHPPFMNFVAEVDTINLFALGLTKDTLGLSGFMEICTEGLDIDSITGELNFRQLALGLNGRALSLDEVNILSAFDDDARRRLNLESPIGNAFFMGTFSLAGLPATFNHYLHHYVRRSSQDELKDNNQHFELNLEFYDAQAIADFVYPGRFDISRMRGHLYVDVAGNNADMDFDLPYLRMGNLKLSQVSVFGSSSDDSLFIDFYADSLLIREVLIAQQISFENYVSRDTLGFETRAMGEGPYNDLSIDGYLDFASDNIGLHFLPSYLRVYENRWNLLQDDRITFTDSVIEVPGLGLYQGSQAFYVSGFISDQRSDTLRLRLNEVDLEQLNPLLAVSRTSVEGYANIDLKASSVLKKAAVFGDVDIEGLVIDGQPLGDLKVQSTYSVERNVADLHAELVNSGDTLINVFGTLGELERDQVIDLRAVLNHSPIHPLEKILRPTFSDLSGRATADLHVGGKLKELELTGEAELENARLRVDFLEQYYNVNKRVSFSPGSINFEQAEITDDTGGRGRLNGKILHQHFKQTRFDLNLSAQNLMVLNTEPSFSEAYFGTGRLTGTASFIGPVDLIDIQIRATTERGTRFSIPLDGETNRENLDFITFVSKAEEVRVSEEKRFEVAGINFGMNLTATPDAEFSILFDRVAGDIIRGRGNANIELNIDPQGEMSMFGTYAFSGGDYTFTLANIPSKRFRINEGSTITWTGDPYDATLDLTAVYRQRASIAALLTEGQLTAGRSRTQMNVDTYLKLTGSLLSPNINFEIKFPSINENDTSDPLVARIQNINNNEQELNNQVLALLVAGQFFPSDNLVSTSFLGSTGANSLTEVLSNQINALLSQMFDNVNIGINYRSNNLGGITDATRNDISVALNTTFFNDRVVIDGNFGNSMMPGTTNSAVVGEVVVEYLMTPDGNLRLKAFNKLDDRVIFNRESNYRQGVGISYTENYNSLSELMERPTRFVQDRLLRRIPWLPEGWKGDF